MHCRLRLEHMLHIEDGDNKRVLKRKREKTKTDIDED